MVCSVVEGENRKGMINIQPFKDYNAACTFGRDKNKNKLSICIDLESGDVLSVYRNGARTSNKNLSDIEIDQLSAANRTIATIQGGESYSQHYDKTKGQYDHDSVM